MTKEIIIILLLLALLYFYQQNRKYKQSALLSNDPNYQQEVSETISELKLDKDILESFLDDLKQEKAQLQAKLSNKETELTLILNK
jgi:flagellar biosynthesis regulator FlaF